MDFNHNLNEENLDEANKIIEKSIGDKGIQIQFMKKTATFTKLTDLLDFLKDEVPIWVKTLNDNEKNQLDNSISNITKFQNQNYYRDNFRNFINLVRQLNNKGKIVFSKSAVGKYINKLSPEEAKGFLSYLIDKPIEHFTNNSKLHPDTISGVFFGILYEKGFVKKKEIQSLLDSPNFVFDEHQEEYEDNIEKLNEQNEEITQKSKELNKYIEYIRNVANNHIKYLNTNWEEQVHELIEEKKSNIETLEEQYSEKLKLEGPTQYWRELSSKYNKRGVLWFTVAVALAILGGCIIWYMVSNINFATDSVTNSIQQYLLIAVVISITFFLLNQSIKIALSQIHLSMDYKEREQITMVYLALLGEEKSAISPEEKQIILQSIFSRSDSGLTKGDSTPTLPNNTMNQILNKLGK